MKEWITGRNPVYEVLCARRRHFFRLWLAQGAEEKGRLSEIIKMFSALRLPVERVPRQRLDAMGEGHQGVALEASSYPYVTLDDIVALARQKNEDLLVLVLDALQNPQNLGTLLRTAEAVGAHGVLMPLRRAAGITPAVVHASAGASEHLLVAGANLAQSITSLKEAGAWVIGLDGSPESIPLEQARLDGPLALVVGSEGSGMRSLVQRSCDLVVRLPMRGRIESLNAAVAGSVVLYSALQARKLKP